MQRSEWDRWTEALKSVSVWAEDVCIEVEIDGDYKEIEDLPGEVEYCEYEGQIITVDWQFLADFPQIEKQVLRTFEIWSEVDAADRYTRRAEQGWCNY